MNKGGTPENLILFQKGKSGNPKGKPKGTRNRATVLRELLDLVVDGKHPVSGDNIKLTQEQLMGIKIIQEAIEKGNVQAFNAVMDSVYGKPKSDDNLNVTGNSVSVVIKKDTDDGVAD